MNPGHPQFRSRLHQAATRMLPGALIIVLAALGLFVMHGLGSHGTAGGHAPAQLGVASAGTHGHDATPDSAVESGLTAAVVPGADEHPEGGGLAMACVFVLLLMARHLLPLRRSIIRVEPALRQGPAWLGAGAVAPQRPPSLLALGISRT